MDFSKLAQDVLANADASGILSEDLAKTEEGMREFLGRLGQAVLQLHIDAQKQLGYEGSSRTCSCPQEQRFVGYRTRTLETLFGPLAISRAYYHCGACGCSQVPFDCAQGLGTRAVSVALGKLTVELSRDMSYAKAQEKLSVLLGRRLSAQSIRRITTEVGAAADAMELEESRQVKADRSCVPAPVVGRLYVEADGVMVHRVGGWQESKVLICRWQDAQEKWHQRYLCRNETIEDFAPLAWSCMHVSGLDNARQSILLGDGIPWIWNHLGPLADEAVQILDWYHAKEHLWKAARVVLGEGTPACEAFATRLESLLWESEIAGLLEVLRHTKKQLRSTHKRQAIEALEGYVQTHRLRMDYKAYRDQGLDIGSGAVEGACENHVHYRMKRGSPVWSDRGCQSMLSLRSCYANGRRDQLWNRKPLVAA
jgi:hypothetical protein